MAFASRMTNKGLEMFQKGEINIGTTVLKIMLLKTIPTSGWEDDDFVGDFTTHGAVECDATGYTGGYGGAGRKASNADFTLTAAQSDTDNKSYITIGGDLTWTALGGASNNNIKGALLIKEVTSDALSPVVAMMDFTDTDTNGGDFKLSWASNRIAEMAHAA